MDPSAAKPAIDPGAAGDPGAASHPSAASHPGAASHPSAAGDPSTAGTRKHDVHFTTSARNTLMYTANRGVTLMPDAIVWTFDGKPDGAPFKNIVDVCVQRGPGAHRFVRVCHITFADRFELLVTDGNELAVPTQAQRSAYRGFMHDLHTRLVAHGVGRDGPPITFRAGFAAKLHRWLKLRVTLWILVFVGIPLAAFLMTGDVKPFLVLVGALFCGAIFWRLVHANTPRSYDPARPPKELVD